MSDKEKEVPTEDKKVVVFPTTHQTLTAERLLKERRVCVRPVSRPRRITSECGLALEFSEKDEERLLEVCRENELDLVGTFPYSGT